jgi:hypothetical protein
MSCKPTKHNEQEAQHILQIYGRENAREIIALLERQFGVLTGRAQVLLGLCGIVITTTGFSGRAIALTGLAAQWLIVSGIFLVLSSAAAIVWGILQLNWITQFAGSDLQPALARMLAYRDRKTRAYRLGLILLVVGLALYVSAIALMVLAPPGSIHVQGWGDVTITPGISAKP